MKKNYSFPSTSPIAFQVYFITIKSIFLVDKPPHQTAKPFWCGGKPLSNFICQNLLNWAESGVGVNSLLIGLKTLKIV